MLIDKCIAIESELEAAPAESENFIWQDPTILGDLSLMPQEFRPRYVDIRSAILDAY